MGVQRASGYNWRALVEADIGRYKRVIGDALRSRTEGRQTTEVAIAVASLNRMLKLRRAAGVRSPHINVDAGADFARLLIRATTWLFASARLFVGARRDRGTGQIKGRFPNGFLGDRHTVGVS
jgi:hypothetical protein